MSVLADLRAAKGWKKLRLIEELKRAARNRGIGVASDASLDRMIREWESGRRPLVGDYLALFCDVYGCTAAELGCLPDDEVAPEEDEATALARELLAATTADAGLVDLFKAQTENIRQMDRRLGAGALLPQSRAHVDQMEGMLRHGVSAGSRAPIARELADAAALAGWQALDLGQYREAWALHETAKVAALEAEDASLLAHATAQQAYALIDIGQADQAVLLVRHAHERDVRKLPSLMRTWLFAAEAEAHAAAGNDAACRQALDAADASLPADATDPDLPFLFLAGAHLARWRGNCLARLGAQEAVDNLRRALESMEAGFTRAEAGLRCDLALALTVRGELDEAREHAQRAQQLATLTKSLRQRRRVEQLLRVP